MQHWPFAQPPPNPVQSVQRLPQAVPASSAPQSPIPSDGQQLPEAQVSSFEQVPPQPSSWLPPHTSVGHEGVQHHPASHELLELMSVQSTQVPPLGPQTVAVSPVWQVALVPATSQQPVAQVMLAGQNPPHWLGTTPDAQTLPQTGEQQASL